MMFWPNLNAAEDWKVGFGIDFEARAADIIAAMG